jgi:DDE superfamily endonuclease/Winged helix-turn helix
MHSVDVGLTQEQLMQLRSVLKGEGFGKPGHSRSPVENARALLHIHAHQQHGLSFDAAVKATAQAELASPSTLRAAAEELNNSGTLTTPRTPVDRSNPLHPFYSGESGPPLAAEQLIHRELHEVTLNNVFQSCTTLRHELEEQLGVVVSKSTVRRWLHALGYQYGKKHFVNQARSHRNALIRSYIYKYAAALKEQEDGTAIIVYMDESYVHAHHCTSKLWYSLFSSTKNEVRGDNKGKRIIIMHAMTKDGLLEVEGTEPSNILTELYHSCALIFDEVCVDGITPADYHDTINGEKFIGWMRQRLFPTVQKRYPGKEMYLVLDNAKYHHHRGPDWFSPSNKNKGQLADFLRQREVKSFTVDGATFPASKFSADARGKAGGPTLVQLRSAVKAHLTAHPEINTTVPQQLMDDKGFELLYTPPYVSDLQPIEMIWAFTKALVAKQSHRSRTAHACAVQTREAMDQVTAGLCQKQIAHCHAWIQRFMQSEEGGSLQQFGTLQALLPLAEALQQSEEVPATPAPAAEDDEEDEGEAGWMQ